MNRRGRILRWTEGEGYAYSDLSERNKGEAFPHVFFVDLTDTSSGCLVTIRINGRWTTRFVGRTLTRLWLWWNLVTIRYGAENAILRRMI